MKNLPSQLEDAIDACLAYLDDASDLSFIMSHGILLGHHDTEAPADAPSYGLDVLAAAEHAG